MVRNLFISIQEPSTEPRRAGGRTGRPARGSDPGGDFVQPDPDDPGGDFVQPDPDDPGGDFVQPDPDDPGGDFVQPDPDDPRYEGYPVYGDPRAVATVQELPFAGLGGGCCCKHGEEDEEDEEESRAASAHPYSGFVIVRLAADVQPLHFDNLYKLAQEQELDALRAVLKVELGERDEEEDGEAMARGVELESFGPRDRPEDPIPARKSGRRKRPKNWVGDWPYEDEDPKKPDDGDSTDGDPPNGNGSTGEPAGVLRSAPLIDLPALHATCDGHHELRKATLYVIEELEKQAQTTRFRPLHSLTSYWRLDLRPYPDRVEEVVEALNRLREVDVAYRELSVFDSQTERTGAGYHEDQGYLDEAPLGIGARWAWEQISAGASTAPGEESAGAPKVRILDLEQGWIQDHEAFGERLPDPLYGDNRAVPGAEALGQHGTAVLGQLAASSKLLGAHQGATFWLASHYKGEGGDPPYPFPRTNGHVAAAIVNALATTRENPQPLTRGDVLLLEVQRGRFPTEIDPADFDAIRLASAIGVIVVEAAGNGNYDLDRVRDPADGRTFRRGDSRFVDSGAIFVGASFAALPHDRAPFSNFGSRVDCFAWGEGVTTAGYGDLVAAEGDHKTYYTNTFSGTSSAAPVIAGAAALVQTLHRQHAATPLRPGAMRALLSNPATGVRQGPNVGGHIGIMPDLRRVLGSELNLVPQLYLRKRPGDEGERSGPEEAISSSPDILASTASSPNFGHGSGTEHDPAPGGPLQPGGEVYVRVCNRGGGMGAGGDVHLFSAPAATLITPEHWRLIDTVPVPDAPQGDTLAVSEGRSWPAAAFAWDTPPGSWSTLTRVEPHSLLAVLPQDGVDRDWPVLPPGPPYFQWSIYRKFLRRRGVAWRNVHRVDASAGDLVLAFHLAGTPDLERAFDVEVIQRLPQGAKVTLAAQPALVAKLHQRQPWLTRTDDTIELPQRRSTRFGRLVLPARYYAPVWLRIEGSVGAGHSLAVRQLWRGEEVGRITWHFSSRSGGRP